MPLAKVTRNYHHPTGPTTITPLPSPHRAHYHPLPHTHYYPPPPNHLSYIAIHKSNETLQYLGTTSQQDLPCTPLPKKTSRWDHFFSHRCLVPPKKFPQRKSEFCRRYSHYGMVWYHFI